MTAYETLALTLNVPEFFADKEFVDWLLFSDCYKTANLKTASDIDEGTAMVVMVDPTLNGEGSDSDMPELQWDAIVNACIKAFGRAPGVRSHILVRLTNYAVDEEGAS